MVLNIYNIRMDFSDFKEFLGPLIFGLIAWLSTYFQKKKNKPKNTLNPTPVEVNKDSDSSLISDLFLDANDSVKLSNPKIDEEKNVLEIESDDNNQKTSPEISKEKSNEKLKKSKKPILHRKPIKGHHIREKLKNKKSLKDAFVMKEILDRKF